MTMALLLLLLIMMMMILVVDDIIDAVVVVVDQNILHFKIAMNEWRIRMVQSGHGFHHVAENLQHFALRKTTTCAPERNIGKI